MNERRKTTILFAAFVAVAATSGWWLIRPPVRPARRPAAVARSTPPARMPGPMVAPAFVASDASQQAADYFQGLINGYALLHHCFPRALGARGERLDVSHVTDRHLAALLGERVDYELRLSGNIESYSLSVVDAETGAIVSRRASRRIQD